MDIVEIIRLSISNLKSFKFRTFLTMLGIIMGIGSVVLISSLGAGFENNLLSDIKSSVQNGVTVTISKKYTSNKSYKLRQQDKFSEEDISALKKLSFVESVLPTGIIDGFSNEKNAVLSGIQDNSTFYMEAAELTSGRLFFPEEYSKDSNVIILERVAAKSIFKNENPIGKTIYLTDYESNFIGRYTIIGTYKSYSETANKIFGATNYYMHAIAPLQHVDYVNGNNKKIYSFIRLNLKNKKTFKNDVETLRQFIQRKNIDKPDFYEIKPLSEELNQVSGILSKISVFISLIAAISLIVGGIGVMNIMLVSVNERITEIGLRKAIGAKNKDILMQFLIESMIVTVIGGVIGILSGYGLAGLIGIFVKIFPILKLNVLIVSIIVSITIGLIFGIYPAKQAAKLSPMEALRKE